MGSKQKHLGADRETADDSPQQTTHGAGADGEADAHAEADDRRRRGDHRERRRGQRVVCYDCGALAAVYSNPRAFLFLSLFLLVSKISPDRTRTHTRRHTAEEPRSR